MRPIMRAVRLALDPTLFGGASERIAPQGTDFRYPWPVDPRPSHADRTDTCMSILSKPSFDLLISRAIFERGTSNRARTGAQRAPET